MIKVSMSIEREKFTPELIAQLESVARDFVAHEFTGTSDGDVTRVGMLVHQFPTAPTAPTRPTRPTRP
ncbi:hypothetical protein [Mesorhizobium sp.]|uniref:hypothetical protein n=1 Tax=Mesorhizobium sp. TaxID=1871066 RepID=UPI000FE7F652|nr:hypothetical protein [Mesorhizobium sp.]RWA98957.1 MAG: hypothetical protein EOQ33_25240 [Mesorhizobium sp.]